MDRESIREIRMEVAFWGLLILAQMQTNVWWAAVDTLVAVLLFFALHWPERKPGRGFWDRVWDR